MSNPCWDFLESGAMALSADDMANPLRDTHLSPAEILMREAVQNSADEKKAGTDEPVRFVVSRFELTGEEKRNLVRRLDLRSIKNRARHFGKSHGWFKNAETFIRNLENPEIPIPILSLSDYNTKGLGGVWNRGQSIDNRFHNLVLSIGGSEKLTQGSGMLGSYGFGKMVYALASNIRTVAYYSVFEPDEGSKGEYSRFMATGFYPRHKYRAKDYTGHAFLGEGLETSKYPTRPLTNEAATEFVGRLGFDTRNEGETGLTVFLLDCPLTIPELRTACEKFWWPRLMDPQSDGYVSIEFFDDGKRVSGISPTQVSPLRPFIACYRNLRDDHSPTGYHVCRIPKKGPRGGNLCLKGLTEEQEGSDFVNTVALIRGGLVIKYETKYAREGAPSVAGVFVTSEENVDAFTYSEPPAHDDWNENNGRLIDSLGDDGAGLIKRTHNVLKTEFRDFQIRLDQQEPEPTVDDIRFLDRILAPIFDKKPRNPTPPDPQARAVSIHKRARQEPSDPHIRRIFDVSIGLTESAGVAEADIQVTIELKSLAEADGIARGRIPRVVHTETPSGRKMIADSETRSFPLRIDKGARVELTAEADTHPSWRVRWEVSVSANDGGGS